MLANPIRHSEGVYPKFQRAAEKEGVDDRSNLTFHQQTTHPHVEKRGPAMVPGWNASNAEIAATERHGCYVLFDRDGQLVFQGRASFAEIEALVARLVRG